MAGTGSFPLLPSHVKIQLHTVYPCTRSWGVTNIIAIVTSSPPHQIARLIPVWDQTSVQRTYSEFILVQRFTIEPLIWTSAKFKSRLVDPSSELDSRNRVSSITLFCKVFCAVFCKLFPDLSDIVTAAASVRIEGCRILRILYVSIPCGIVFYCCWYRTIWSRRTTTFRRWHLSNSALKWPRCSAMNTAFFIFQLVMFVCFVSDSFIK